MHLMTWTTSSWQAIRKSKQPNSVFSFYLGVVGRLLYNLRRHPKRCSNKCVSLYLCVRQLAGHTKVRQFDFPLFWQQDVGSWKQQRKVGKYSGKVRIIINNIFLVFSLQTILNVTLKLTKTHFCKLGYNLFIHYFIFFFLQISESFYSLQNFTFDVSVYFLLRVQILQSLQDFPQYRGNLHFI